MKNGQYETYTQGNTCPAGADKKQGRKTSQRFHLRRGVALKPTGRSNTTD